MAVGDEAQVAARSYTAIGKEAVFGTYNTATTAVEPISNNIMTEIESIKLPTMNVNRGEVRRVQTNKNVGGTLEAYLHNQESILLMASAVGPNTLASSSLTGGAYTHSLSAANHETFGSLCFNVRKGDTITWQYSGGRVNALTIAGTVGEPVKISAEMVFQDSTQSANDLATSLSVTTLTPWVFHQGQFIYGATTTSLTTTNAEPIQSFELTINNNIESGVPARELGTQIPGVLPPKNRSVELTVTQRFDTTTAVSRFTEGTQGSIRIQFDGSSISAEHNHKLQIDMPVVYNRTGDAELPGPGEILVQNMEFDVLVDNPNTTTGKDIAITVINNVASY